MTVYIRQLSNKEQLVSIVRGFRPYTPNDLKRSWHDQIKGFLTTLGSLAYGCAVPEYPVPSPYSRGGTGRIDVVWLEGANAKAAFEIDGTRKMRSVAKLIEFEAPWKFIVSAGKTASEYSLRGSRGIPQDQIGHIVIESTNDPEVHRESWFTSIGSLLEIDLRSMTLVGERELKDFPRREVGSRHSSVPSP